jgi:hypothetical protein
MKPCRTTGVEYPIREKTLLGFWDNDINPARAHVEHPLLPIGIKEIFSSIFEDNSRNDWLASRICSGGLTPF